MKPLTRYALCTGMNTTPTMTIWPEGPWYRAEQADARIAELEAEVARLRSLAACAYQFAGAHDAPVAWLDALSAAANGEPFSDDGLLPYCGDTLDQIASLKAENARLREDAERYRWLRTATQLGGETMAVFVIDEFSEIANKGEWLSDDDLDAAIDKARGKE